MNTQRRLVDVGGEKAVRDNTPSQQTNIIRCKCKECKLKQRKENDNKRKKIVMKDVTKSVNESGEKGSEGQDAKPTNINEREDGKNT